MVARETDSIKSARDWRVDAARKTEKVNVWLTPEQVAWLKSKENVSETIRTMTG